MRYRTALPAGASAGPQPSATVSGKRGGSQTVGEGLHGPPALRPSRLRRPLRPNSVPAHTPLRQRPRLVEGRVGRAFTALPPSVAVTTELRSRPHSPQAEAPLGGR